MSPSGRSTSGTRRFRRTRHDERGGWTKDGGSEGPIYGSVIPLLGQLTLKLPTSSFENNRKFESHITYVDIPKEL